MVDVDGVVEDLPAPYRFAEEQIRRLLAEPALEEDVIGSLERKAVPRIELICRLAGPTRIGDTVLIDDDGDPPPLREPK